ncbi:MAG: hypothetical protein DME84_09200 [Verrucomicrobia bacterium]|nr:MAG: hypothetical protein DME84_09200 [Verrucomicrobiota bacterium]
MTKQTSILFLTMVLSVALPCVAQTPEPFEVRRAEAAFEELPELKASEILKPELLKGPHYVVRDPVPTASGMNQFTIDSDFGLFEADGNEMLLQRLKEIDAIARLRDVSRTDAFKKSLVAAAKSPLNSAKNIARDPAQAISNVPKGIMKFLGRAKETVQNVGKGSGEDEGEGSRLKDVMGYSDKKRQIALQMGIDPYSTNTVLQKELDDVAWAAWAGGFTFSVATFPISGPIGAALTVTNLNTTVEQLLREKSPSELEQINRATFRAMGASASDIERILHGGAFTPTQSTTFAVNLKSLKGVANRGAFVKIAAQKSTTEADALFCVHTAALMNQIHEKIPIARITMLHDFPICVAKDGTIVVALQWDYAAWTSGAGSFTNDVQKLAAQSGKTPNVFVALSGQVSPRLRQELEMRGFTLHDRLVPGPLR